MSSVSNLRSRISDSSLDQVVLEEMIRHGFWGRDAEVGEMPAEFFERRAALQAEIADILARDRRLSDPDKALQAVMKERMRRARLKRVETKRKAIEARNARAAAFDARKRAEVISLGDVSSAPLQSREANNDRLTAQGLPVIEGAIALSEAMGIGLPELKFLAHDRKVARVTHYQSFEIPKKTGGVRVISAPKPRMKRAQYWVLDNILACIEPHDAAHGFRTGRSILTNAAPHVGQELVINMDLQDFFPTITYGRVKGLFAAMGYAEADAAVLALIATEAPRDTINVDGTVWHVATGPRATPQGAPTSPAIANLVARKLDRRLLGLARRFGFSYTRYADDMTFSGPFPGDQGLKIFHAAVRAITTEEGFTLHRDKTRFMRRGGRQEVTGLTVNDKVSVPRAERRKFRAWLHQAEQSGTPQRPFRTGNPVTTGQGYASFLYMVGGTEGLALAERAWLLLGRQTGASSENIEQAQAFRTASAEGRLPTPDWWQPAEPPPFEPIPLPAYDRKDQETRDVQTSIPKAGERQLRRAQIERPGADARSRAALSRSNRAWGGQASGTSPSGQSSWAKWIMSFFAFFLQVLPYIGVPLAVFAFYHIWKPQAGYLGATTVWHKLLVAAKFLFVLLGIDFALVMILAVFSGIG
ncbi:reverse transcriptase family protein [Ruegeria sp. Ofav3-42]|uniref:reverse transcriptase family protein n=1 Tax=Ruegeria sp. Ofav3-42 TaxID=2917759 RepID=UPI001EF5A455|nr:reverse transcriptase family protein [Ruegeria sp. Ofav3-42]MCG7521474.1 reverse transcriptase family protein [Ruegeria sp. Ofav3-42]